MQEVRIFSRAIGLLGNGFFGQRDVAPLDRHTLAQAHYSPRGITSRDLCQLFLASPTTISSCANRLEKRKLLTKVPHHTDKRMSSLIITDLGTRFLAQLEHGAVALLAQMAGGGSTAEQHELAHLFTVYTGGELATDEMLIAEDLSLELVSSPEVYGELRSFLIKERNVQGKTVLRHPTIIEPRSIIFAIYRSKELVGVFELEPLDGDRTLRCTHGFVTKSLGVKAVNRAVNTLMSQLAVLLPSLKNIVVSGDDISNSCARLLSAHAQK